MEKPLRLATNLWRGLVRKRLVCDALIAETADAEVSALYGNWIASLASRVLPPVNAREGSTHVCCPASRSAFPLAADASWAARVPHRVQGHAQLSQWKAKRESARSRLRATPDAPHRCDGAKRDAAHRERARPARKIRTMSAGIPDRLHRCASP